MFNRLQWLRLTITAAVIIYLMPMFGMNCHTTLSGITKSFSGIAVCRAGDPDDRDYLRELNAPILRITPKSKSYESYFQAWMKLKINDPRAPQSMDDLQFGSDSLKQAMAWVAEPAQQDALDILLEKDGQNPNITFREVFGLPYGTRDIPTDMESKHFAVFIEDDILSNADFAYFPFYNQLICTLLAEAHHEADTGNGSRAVDSLIAAMRMGRQLCDRSYTDEIKTGMRFVISVIMNIRSFMWNYRTSLTPDDYKKFTEEIELLDLDTIKPPRANRLVGDQLVSRIFGKDLRPDREVFARTMAQFESRRHPLLRFSATAKWRDLMKLHATYNETLNEINVIDGDIRLRWRFAYDDPELTGPLEIQTISPIRFAIPRAIFRGIEELLPLRHDMIVKQHGVVSAAGVAGYQKQDGGSLILGKKASGAPISLKQVQPSFVLSEDMLDDPQNPDGGKFQYFVVTNRESIRTNTLKTFTINTKKGPATLVEGWPVLYSLGWDGDDDEANNHVTKQGQDGDFIFWPPVEIIARER